MMTSPLREKEHAEESNIYTINHKNPARNNTKTGGIMISASYLFTLKILGISLIKIIKFITSKDAGQELIDCFHGVLII
jgi:hypothetical protein